MVSIDCLEIMAADMGAANPLPDIKNVQYIHAGFEVTKNVTKEESEHLGKGMINTVLPYMIQDGYTRDKKLQKIKTVVLENEFLKAVFLPDYGGRLWQLFDKKNNRDILYTNTVIQPCNFAILNAWLSGGVEFNVGIKGHTPLTCEAMHCEKIDEHTVKFFEFERIRKVNYSITAYLPDGSQTLYIRPRIENTSDNEIFMYWWSNIAFPETEKTRVIVPANSAIHCSYQEDHYVVDKTSIPVDRGVDVSYSMNLGASADYFYRIPDAHRKWIAGVDPNGVGLLHYSNDFLKTRKLFLWGNKRGGRHWNEFLSEKGQAYVEIQAGVATTQLEHLPMAAKSVWEWTEGYTSINGADDYYGDWEQAIARIEKVLDEKIANGAVAPDKLADMPIATQGELVHTASGWGALENKLRAKQGKIGVSAFERYPEVDDKATADFRQLLEKGYLPCPSVEETPTSYVVDEFWRDALKTSAKTEQGNHWYTYLQLGVVEYALGNRNAAKDAWEQSAKLSPNVWAWRNLSALYKNEWNDVQTALSYQEKAFARKEAFACLSLVKEYAAWLTGLGKDQQWIDTYSTLSEEMQGNGRLQVYLAIALLHVGKPKQAAQIITKDFILSDVKEGELSLSYLWREIYTAIIREETGLTGEVAQQVAMEKYPLPYELDFRMHG
ncbi:MAG: DUF5107 domain-containing protein [Clostridiales bacterium]|nr:DUF5107 domain-containing protein [Clostridiales bacterium]